jgi:hypothetical protein
MIATCANPTCNAPFRYLRRGKIFLLDADGVGSGSKTNPAHRRIEYFWLCGECCSAWHLIRGTDGTVRTCKLPLPPDPHVILKIFFDREMMPLGSQHRRLGQ